MNLPNKTLLQDMDVQNARIAMERARIKAIEKAEHTNHDIVVFEHEKIVYMKPEILKEMKR